MEAAINPGRLVRKADYRRISISLDKGEASLFLHKSSLSAFQLLLKRKPLVSSHTPNGVLLGLGAEDEVEVEEVMSLAQVSLALLRQETFLLLNSTWEKLPKGGLCVALQEGEMSVFPLAKIPTQPTQTVFLRS